MLLDEVAVIQHSSHFDHAAQLNFSPTAADGRRAESLDQVSGFAAQTLLGAFQGLHLLFELAIGLIAGFLEQADLLVDLTQGFADGRNQLLDGLLAQVEIAACLGLELAERRLSLLQKRGVVVSQGVRCKRTKGFPEFLLRLRYYRQLFLLGRALHAQRRIEGSRLFA